MKQLLLFFILCPLFAFGQEEFTFEHNGLTRDYILYQPDNLLPNAPLVFVLHGYTSSASTIMGYCGMNDVADINGFAVCYPQGSKDNGNINHWNAQLTISSRDDIGFLSSLAGYLQTTHNLNPEHTFTCGMSNGGFMSYTLACERPDVFKAIASVTGTMSGQTWESCDPDNPVPVFQISGTSDNVVPADGSMSTFGGWGGAPNAQTVSAYWRDLNDCTISDTIPFSNRLDGVQHSEGINGNEVWFYLIDNWGHNWPGSWAFGQTGIDASTKIWEFFNKIVDNTITNTSSLELESFTVSIYPNPTSDRLIVDSKLNQVTKFELFNIYGQLVDTGLIQSSSTALQLGHLPAGVYLLTIANQSFKIQKI